jgi:hypothetical protein
MKRSDGRCFGVQRHGASGSADGMVLLHSSVILQLFPISMDCIAYLIAVLIVSSATQSSSSSSESRMNSGGPGTLSFKRLSGNS